MTVQHFTQLRIWKDAVQLTKQIYLLTKGFPNEEKFGITSQLRRCTSSIGANIAEGFGRKSQKEKLQFIMISKGSLLETEHFVYLSEELGYISKEESERLVRACESLAKSIQSYGKNLKRFS